MVSRFKEMGASKKHKGKTTMKAKKHHSKKIIISKVLLHSVQKFLKDADKSTNEAVKYLEIEATKAYHKIAEALSLRSKHKSFKANKVHHSDKNSVDKEDSSASEDNTSDNNTTTTEVDVIIEESLSDNNTTTEVDVIIEESLSDNNTTTEVDVIIEESLSDNNTTTEVDVIIEESLSDNNTTTEVDVIIEESLSNNTTTTEVDVVVEGSSSDANLTKEVELISQIDSVVEGIIFSDELLAEEITQYTQDYYSSYFYGGIALSVLASAAGILYYSATHGGAGGAPIVGLAGNIIKAAVNKYNPFNNIPKLTDLALEMAKQAQDNGLELGNGFMDKTQDVGLLLVAALSTKAKTDEEQDSKIVESNIDILEEISAAIAAGLLDSDDEDWEVISNTNKEVDEATGIPIESFQAVVADLMARQDRIDLSLMDDEESDGDYDWGSISNTDEAVDEVTGIPVKSFQAVGAYLMAQKNIDGYSSNDDDIDDYLSDEEWNANTLYLETWLNEEVV